MIVVVGGHLASVTVVKKKINATVVFGSGTLTLVFVTALFISACVTVGDQIFWKFLEYLLISDHSVQEAVCARLLYLPTGKVFWRSFHVTPQLSQSRDRSLLKNCKLEIISSTHRTTSTVVQKAQLELEMETHLAEAEPTENHTMGRRRLKWTCVKVVLSQMSFLMQPELNLRITVSQHWPLSYGNPDIDQWCICKIYVWPTGSKGKTVWTEMIK